MREFNELEKDIKKTSSTLDRLTEKLAKEQDKLNSLGKFDSKGRANAEKNIALIRKELERASIKAEEATNNMQQFLGQRGINLPSNLNDARKELEMLGKKANEPKKGFEKVKESAQSMFSKLKSGSKESDGVFQKLGKRIMGLAKRVFVFSLIAKAFRGMVSGIQDGLKNFASFSKEYNKVMSDFKSSSATLKNSLATAFAPIVQAIVPYLTQLINWLIVATEKVTAFFSALKGNTVFAKAKKQVVAYGDAVESASNKVASFDDLNVLDNGGSSGGGEVKGADAFETAEIESSVMNFAEKIKPMIDEIRDSMTSWFTGLDFSPLINSFQSLKDAVAPIVESIGTGIKWVLENVLQPFGTFTIESLLPSFFEALASAVELVKGAFDVFKPSLEELWNNVIVPFASFIGDTVITIIDLWKTAFDNLTSVFQTDGSALESVFTFLGEVMTLFSELYQGIVELMISLFSGVVESFTTDEGIISTLFQTLGTVFNVLSQVAKVVFDAITTAFNWVVGIFTSDSGVISSLFDMLKGVFQAFGDIVSTIFGSVSDLFDKLTDFIDKHSTTINKIVLGVKTAFWGLGEGIKAVVKLITTIITGLSKTIATIFKGMREPLKDFIAFFKNIFTGNFKDAFKSLANAVIGIINTMISAIEGAVNAIVDGINSLSFDVPDWIPVIGGETFGFDIPRASWGRIPRLATGGITNRPTTALIGESGREAVLPLENNTEWMDELASKLGSQEVVIKFEGSLSQLARVLNPVLDAESNRIGKSLVVN